MMQSYHHSNQQHIQHPTQQYHGLQSSASQPHPPAPQQLYNQPQPTPNQLLAPPYDQAYLASLNLHSKYSQPQQHQQQISNVQSQPQLQPPSSAHHQLLPQQQYPHNTYTQLQQNPPIHQQQLQQQQQQHQHQYPYQQNNYSIPITQSFGSLPQQPLPYPYPYIPPPQQTITNASSPLSQLSYNSTPIPPPLPSKSTSSFPFSIPPQPLKQRIDDFCSYFNLNNASSLALENYMKQKHHRNPQFSWLFQNDSFYSYFEWRKEKEKIGKTKEEMDAEIQQMSTDDTIMNTQLLQPLRTNPLPQPLPQPLIPTPVLQSQPPSQSLSQTQSQSERTTHNILSSNSLPTGSAVKENSSSSVVPLESSSVTRSSLPAAVPPPISELPEILSRLNSSRLSIQTTRKIVLATPDHTKVFLQLLPNLITPTSSPEYSLHIFYLIHDALHRASLTRISPDTLDDFAACVLVYLPTLLPLIYSKQTNKLTCDKLKKLLTVWGERDVYALDSIADLEYEMEKKQLSITSQSVTSSPATTTTTSIQTLVSAPSDTTHPPPTDTLHLPPGYLVTLHRSQSLLSYVPFDPLRLPAQLSESIQKEEASEKIKKAVEDYFYEVENQYKKEKINKNSSYHHDKSLHKESNKDIHSRTRSRSRSRSHTPPSTYRRGRDRSRSRSVSPARPHFGSRNRRSQSRSSSRSPNNSRSRSKEREREKKGKQSRR